MYLNIYNENYGYANATYGDFVAVGNPGLARYSATTASKYWSGSVDIFKYDKGTDLHEYVTTLYKIADNDVLLAAETGSAPLAESSSFRADLQTEASGAAEVINRDIMLVADLYTNMREDGYGLALDINENLLAVGCPYYFQHTRINTFSSSVSGSGDVDVYDLERFEYDAFNSETEVAISASKTGTTTYQAVNLPPGFTMAELSGRVSSGGVPKILSPVSVLSRVPILTTDTSVTFTGVSKKIDPSTVTAKVYLDTIPLVFTIPNPDISLSGSFGRAVTLNDEWLAIGSPHSGSGAVYMYERTAPTATYPFSWSFHSKLVPPISTRGLLFGEVLELNKTTSSLSASLIVGVGNISASKAFLFEYDGTSYWTHSYTFTPNTSAIYPLTFGDYAPYSTTYNRTSSYGTAVSMYDRYVVIGAATDRVVYEYTGSSAFNQGAVYVYYRCATSPRLYDLVLKTYGTDKILKNNRLGYSVDIFGDNIIAGSPKTNVDSITSCYVEATLDDVPFNPSSEDALNGQMLFIQRNTASNSWEPVNVYQRKKRYLSPARSYGYSVAIADQSMVVGAPIVFTDINRGINVPTTQSGDATLDDVTGKSYIYNLNDFRDQFYVGNVFYRNGKIVLMTSGSDVQGIFFNPVADASYEYDLDYKSEYTIYEKQIVCSVSPGEFNTSTNPSAIVSSTSSFDINGNGYFDFQDLDVLLRYMQYKNTRNIGTTTSTNWSSSTVILDDEKSLFSYYQAKFEEAHTLTFLTSSINRFEFVDTWMQDELDLNQDNKIDSKDINIFWKYFANRLTQEGYKSYVTPECRRKLFTDLIDHMDMKTAKIKDPQVRSEFLDYDRLAAADKTGSYLRPYVTTIGLYSGLDLVAVAKLGTPIKVIPELPINFVVKIDF